jgi:inorganic pyrophosphatase
LRQTTCQGDDVPYDFGFIPDTKANDGDPLDVLVLSDEAMFPDREVECRILGVMKASQCENGKEKRNDRFIAVSEGLIPLRGS